MNELAKLTHSTSIELRNRLTVQWNTCQRKFVYTLHNKTSKISIHFNCENENSSSNKDHALHSQHQI